jgi:NDP-sugar pyrophosphorylase family protein
MGGKRTQAVIMAGGLGKRLRPLTDKVPKPMVPVNGRPFLEYELRLLKENGIDELVLCVNYLADSILGYFGSGEKLGLDIRYSEDGGGRPLGVAGALKRAEPFLRDVFFVTYGDVYLRADYRTAMEEFLKTDKLGMMLVFENHNVRGKSDVVVEFSEKDQKLHVVRYDKHRQNPGMVWINYGVSLLRKEALSLITPGVAMDEEEFYGKLIARDQLLARVVKERFYEIGTPASLEEFRQFLSREVL